MMSLDNWRRGLPLWAEISLREGGSLDYTEGQCRRISQYQMAGGGFEPPTFGL